MPVKKVISKGRVPVKIWTDAVESGAIDQLSNLASMPFVFKHVAVMADVHLGKGCCVGTVCAMQKAVAPSIIGVDIGCGMVAVQTGLSADRLDGKLKDLRSEIEDVIPVGFNSNKELSRAAESWRGWSDFKNLSAFAANDTSLSDRARSQLGTLGGGNHFVEVCVDSKNEIWLMLHSGSRNLGKSLAERHMATARDLMKEMFISLPDPDLSYLVQGTPAFDAYLKDLTFAQEFALENREEMMRRLIGACIKVLGVSAIPSLLKVNCHHNYLAEERHFNESVYVARKGAIKAGLGDLGIIPGSMGQKSFIVRGKGSAESFNSCSHGAGRVMSRGEAKRRFTEADVLEQTAGVECRKDFGIIDEIPSAYKDIEEVMENQKDLVEIVAEIKQVLCVKG